MGGAPGAAAGAAAAPTEKLAPLEGTRPNPFLPRDAELATGGKPVEPRLTYHYGTNWAQLPITLRMGFVRPRIPAPRAVEPPAPVEEPATDLIVTSILWTQDGQAMAVYESGPSDHRKSGVVKPGDIVDDWQVAEIWRDHIVVTDRSSGRQRSVYLTVKKAAPAPSSKPAGSGGGGGARGRRPGFAPAPPVQP